MNSPSTDAPAAAPPRTTHVVDGVRLSVVDTAPDDLARPVVVALHGIPESAAAWDGVTARVASTARVIVPDLPGFGLSDKPAGHDYSLHHQARVVGTLLEQLVPGRPVHLAVHDIGGPIGLMWGTGAPGRLASLMILNTTLFPERFRPPPPALGTLIPFVGRRLVADALAREGTFKRQFQAACARPLEPAVLEELFAPYRDPATRAAAAATWGSYRRSVTHLLRARRALGAIDVPTTVLFGARDQYCTPPNARAFADRIPGSRLRLLDDVGHFSPTEAPAEVAEELLALIASRG